MSYQRLVLAAALGFGVTAATVGTAGASRFDKNDFGNAHAGNSPDCQPGNGNGDTGNHFHTGPPGQGNPSPGADHTDNLEAPCAASPTPPGPTPVPPGPSPFVPGSSTSAAGAALTAQQRAALAAALAALQRQATQAPPATVAAGAAHFTG